MAITKRVTAAQLKNIDLRNPTDSDGDKLKIDDLEKPASRYRDIVAEIKPLEEELKQTKADLVSEVSQRRVAREKQDRFFSTCLVTTDSPTSLVVVFQDRFAPIALEHEVVLKRAFAKRYDLMFERGLTVKLKEAVRLQDIERAIGPAAVVALSKFLDFDEHIKPCKGFMQKRAEMRQELDAPTNNAIDVVVAQVQAAPQVRVREPKEDE